MALEQPEKGLLWFMFIVLFGAFIFWGYHDFDTRSYTTVGRLVIVYSLILLSNKR